MYSLVRPLLFQLDAEKSHHLTLSALHWLPSPLFKAPELSPTNAMGLTFSHRIGLAAGLDKNGEHIDALAKLGFSFIELGTVTPHLQTGNPRPRLFRLPEANAIINRMGFNNLGVENLVLNIKKSRYQGIVGVNIGKSRETSLNQASEDYIFCMEKVYNHASYITVNISSPNTPDLRQLQQKAYLDDLLSKICESRKKLSDQHKKYIPLVIKLSPDEKDDALKEIAELIVSKGIEGIVATNTTCSREAVSHLPNGGEEGGLSGQPLLDRSTHCLKVIKEITGDALTLIGVGGIDSIESAESKLEAGADLLQVYTGLIYKGPNLVTRLSRL